MFDDLNCTLSWFASKKGRRKQKRRDWNERKGAVSLTLCLSSSVFLSFSLILFGFVSSDSRASILKGVDNLEERDELRSKIGIFFSELEGLEDGVDRLFQHLRGREKTASNILVVRSSSKYD